ncbi:MAG: MATE family efflux transporter [Trichodesmium sp. St17_bin3_1_1]|nr:MATE family efflux transporter [Trichodesmium sp. St17_bin3_1_1]
MRQKLTEGKIGPILVKLTLPTVLGLFTMLGFIIIDTYFVAQLGTKELAAMSFAFPAIILLDSVSTGLAIGTGCCISKAIGKSDKTTSSHRDRDKVKRLATDSLILSLLIGVILVIIGLTTIDPLFTALGAKAEILPLIRQYMEISYFGVIFVVVPIVGNNIIRATGNTLMPSVVIAVAGIINLVLDPIFIFGYGPIPAMGLQGAALATVISRATILAVSLVFLHYYEQMICLKLPSFKLLLRNWQNVLSIAIPNIGQNIIRPISISFITSLIASYGTAAVAGFGIASKVEILSVMVFLALSTSFIPFVGQNWGAEQYNRVYLAWCLGFQFCLFWGALMAIALGLGGSWVVSLFDKDPEVIKVAAEYLLIVPISYGAFGIILISSAIFNALGKPLPSLLMSLTKMLFLYAPLAYLGSWLFGMDGIFAAACFANVAVGIGAYIWSQKNLSFNNLKEPNKLLTEL